MLMTTKITDFSGGSGNGAGSFFQSLDSHNNNPDEKFRLAVLSEDEYSDYDVS